ncbi:MMPL family transporter [Micrococcales bacterium 31B]|nr:MMPL family transporter [Micrococcales bacterium 31B]
MEPFDDRTKFAGRAPTMLASRRLKWPIVAISLILTALIFGFAPAGLEQSEAGGNLPTGSQSAAVDKALAQFQQSESAPAIVVITRDSGSLSPADLAALQPLTQSLATTYAQGAPLPIIPAEDLSAAIVPVPLATSEVIEDNSAQVAELRADISADLPAGLTAQVTGGPAFKADLAAVFAGADVKLLIATASVVAVLLLVTYRSPFLWLVPLTVIGVADQAAAKLVNAASHLFGFPIDGSITGITSVLVFGAGTNYALLLIARYREELRRHDDRYRAMSFAVRGAGHAVIASSSTVVVALLLLSFASTPMYRILGWASAIGIVVAVIAALCVLPAALLLFPRGIFWPFVPRLGGADPSETGPWARIGRTVVARPRRVALIGTVLLLALGGGLIGIQNGLSQSEQFREVPEAVVGQEVLAKSFGAGYAQPTIVLVPSEATDATVARAQSVAGVTGAAAGDSANGQTQVRVTLASEPGSEQSGQTITALRAALGEQALVGGADAQTLDKKNAADRDTALIIPLVLVAVFLILIVLLRALVAPVLLLATVLASYVASLGAGWLIFDHILGFPALDLGVPLLAFLFLVALGVDYNIFLALRAREEAEKLPTREAMVKALAVTGGVITSAGILLAAVFAVLGVLPLVTLAQLGVIVGFGVLLDTLVVRSLIVPALAAWCGERFWWPRHPRASVSAEVVAEPAAG